MNTTNLAYADERDKSYGLAGMAITLVALDGSRYLYRIDLDAAAADSLCLCPEFGIKGNPRMSAKILWEQTLSELRLATSMAMGNLACRRYVLAHTGISADDREQLRRAFADDARLHCDLDDDEAERLYDSCRAYVDRIFRHNGIQDVAHRFAARLAERRVLSGAEAVEILASLGLS